MAPNLQAIISNRYFASTPSNTKQARRIRCTKTALWRGHGVVYLVWQGVFLLEGNLPRQLRTYAVIASAYLRNRRFNPRLGRTPFEALTGSQPNVANIHVFGSVCYAYLQNTK